MYTHNSTECVHITLQNMYVQATKQELKLYNTLWDAYVMYDQMGHVESPDKNP